MMHAHIGWICTVERLWPYHINDDVYFSLNLSTCILDGEKKDIQPTDLERIKPWTLSLQQEKPTFKICAVARDSSPPKIEDFDNAPVVKLTEISPNIDSIKARYDAIFMEKPSSYFKCEREKFITEMHWSNLLGNASTYPGGIAQALNLAFVFKVHQNTLKPNYILLVVPCFDNLPLPPQAAPQKGSRFQNTDVYAFQYNDRLSVYQKGHIITPLPEVTDSLIDLSTYWLRKETRCTKSEPGVKYKLQSSLQNRDWCKELEPRLSEAMDLAQHMLDSMHNASINTDVILIEELIALRELCLCLIADTSGLGLLVMPNGNNLARFLMHAAFDQMNVKDPSQRDPEINTFLQALYMAERDPKQFKKLSYWLENLKKVPALMNSRALQEVKKDDNLKTLTCALQNLKSLLLDQEIMSQTLLTLWDTVFINFTVWPRVRAALEQILPHFNLNRKYRASLLGGMLTSPEQLRLPEYERPIWSKIIEIPNGTNIANEPEIVLKNFHRILTAYCNGRAGAYPFPIQIEENLFSDLSPQVDPDQIGILPNALKTIKFDRHLNEYFKKFIQRFLQEQVGQAIMPTQVPHSISLQIDVVSDTNDDVDPLRKISGIGVLMRELGTEPKSWKCLNIASIFFRDEQGEHHITDNAMVPYRLQFSNDLKQAFVEFNSEPIVAQSPLSCMNTLKNVSSINSHPSLCFKPFSAQGSISINDWGRYYALKFGAKYDFILFGMGLDNSLPRELAQFDPNSGYLPQIYIQPTEFQFRPDDCLIRNVTYLRRVPIGCVRYAGFKDDIQKPFPSYPTSVTPLARDLGLLKSDTEIRLVADSGTHEKKFKDDRPFILLWNAEGSREFSFTVRPPATDLKTWDRTISDSEDDETKFLRKSIYADYNRFLPKTPSEQPRQDISINDPAVSGFLVTLQNILDPSMPKENLPSPQYFSFSPYILPTKDPDSGEIKDPGIGKRLTSVQSGKMNLKCIWTEKGNNAKLCPNNTGQGFCIEIPEGQVYELQIIPLVLKKDKNKFDEFTHEENDPFPDKTGKRLDPEKEVYFLVPKSAFRILLEGATAEMPTEKDLWHAMQIEESESKDAICLNLSRLKSSFDFIHEIEVWKQEWCWKGRPIEEPASNFTDLQQKQDLLLSSDKDQQKDAWDFLNEALAYEVPLFADRPDADCEHNITHVNFAQLTSIPENSSFQYPSAFQIYKHMIEPVKRARYFRLAIRAKSRYSGLPGMNISIRESLLPIHEPSQEDKIQGYTRWKRWYIPCRLPKQAIIPKPNIKLVYPLPSRSAPDAMPDILVVADEQWYQHGGLAESLVVEVEMAKSPGKRYFPEEKEWPEFGPDPIVQISLYEDKANPMPRLDFSQNAPQAFGTTFDLIAEAPLFPYTCFRVPGPIVIPATPNGYDWAFCKLKFKRKVTLSPTDTIISEPTEAFWVQFLPDASTFRVKTEKRKDGENTYIHRDFTTLSFGLDVKGNLYFTKTEDSILFWQGQESGVFELWLVLTRKIIDAFSRANQEDFVAIYQADLQTKNFLKIFSTHNFGNALKSNLSFSLRILKVQRSRISEQKDNDTEVFETLFGEGDTRARIVSISSPIAVNHQSSTFSIH